jgi:hypothetical protein
MSQYSVSPIITSNVDFDIGSWSGYNYFPVDCTSGNITIELPTSVWDGLSFYFNRIDSTLLTSLTFTAHTGTINGSSSLIAGGKTTIEFVYLSGNWMAPRFSYT